LVYKDRAWNVKKNRETEKRQKKSGSRRERNGVRGGRGRGQVYQQGRKVNRRGNSPAGNLDEKKKNGEEERGL